MFERSGRNIEYNFSYLDFKNDFYEKYPEFIVKDDKRLEILEAKILKLEQYQGQLLDKVSVFTEMIDDLQKNKELAYW